MPQLCAQGVGRDAERVGAVSPWVWFLAGWLFAWLPLLLVLGLTWILDLRTSEEDRYWRKQTEPIRNAWRRHILTTECYDTPISLAEFPGRSKSFAGVDIV